MGPLGGSKGCTRIFAFCTDSAIHLQEALVSIFTFRFTFPAYACQAHNPITITKAIEATEVPATMPVSEGSGSMTGGVVDVPVEVAETVRVELEVAVASGTGR